MDPAILAAAAIASAVSYIVELGKEAAKSAAGEAGKSAWEWIKGKLTSGTGKAALDDLEKSPGDADNQTMAAAALSKFLKSDQNALAELAKLMAASGGPATVQTAILRGDGSFQAQNSGSGNITINTGTARTVKPPKAT